MSNYQELIKNFERIRDYMRQFFLYGFKVRSEFGEKSGRTYDNERRRIESYLAGYTLLGESRYLSTWTASRFPPIPSTLHGSQKVLRITICCSISFCFIFLGTVSLSLLPPSVTFWPSIWKLFPICRQYEINAVSMNDWRS